MTTRAASLAALVALCTVSAGAAVVTWSTRDTKLRLDRQTGRVEALQHRPSKASWVNKPFSICNCLPGHAGTAAG